MMIVPTPYLYNYTLTTYCTLNNKSKNSFFHDLRNILRDRSAPVQSY